MNSAYSEHSFLSFHRIWIEFTFLEFSKTVPGTYSQPLKIRHKDYIQEKLLSPRISERISENIMSDANILKGFLTEISLIQLKPSPQEFVKSRFIINSDIHSTSEGFLIVETSIFSPLLLFHLQITNSKQLNLRLNISHFFDWNSDYSGHWFDRKQEHIFQMISTNSLNENYFQQFFDERFWSSLWIKGRYWMDSIFWGPTNSDHFHEMNKVFYSFEYLSFN